MNIRYNIIFSVIVGGIITMVLLAFTFERPFMRTVQTGFRGTAMEQVVNPRLADARFASQQAPAALEAADPEGPRASEVYENVQVLGHLSIEQFGRIMQAMTLWIYPENEADPENTGCNACHVPGNFAADDKYQKVVARRMTQMVQTINSTWTNHVGQVGVTCYTCHRGQAVPAQVWSTLPVTTRGGSAATAREQNIPSTASGYSTLPADPFTPYLMGDEGIRMQTQTPRPTGNLQSINQTEWNYSLMMHFSQALGVNCTFCHNSRNFSSWEESPPQRATAWYGIRMVRQLNNEYIEPLRPSFPPHRLGPAGDTLKANCATCHQGVWEPLYGAPMLRDYPELLAPAANQRTEVTPR